MPNKFIRPLFFALGVVLVLQIFAKNPAEEIISGDIVVTASDKVVITKEVVVNIENHGDAPITIPTNCPQNPLKVERYINGEWVPKEAVIPEEYCKDMGDIVIQPGGKHIIPYHHWSWKLFDEIGRYRISLETTLDGKDKVYSHELAVTPPSIFRKIGSELFYKPILNSLILLISLSPWHSLGWGVILLTILIKIILLAPNQKALKAQKKMQKVQPELEGIKVKYKDNPQKQAEETMKIWKKYKINPASSCMPMLIQFPVLIALFYVVKDGLYAVSPHLLYSSLQSFDTTQVDVLFLGIMNLTEPNRIILPIIVGGLQFIQMKMMMGKQLAPTDPNNPMAMMSKTMQYTMPILIAVFTATMPAAVGLYWGTSTLFGVGQQIVVNRSKD